MTQIPKRKKWQVSSEENMKTLFTSVLTIAR